MKNSYNKAIASGVLLCAAVLAAPVFAQTTVAGTLAGQFSVNESGAATYAIPISVPPGVAGMQPQLSLGYSSQSGNGLLGMGWSLSGLSAISRCPRTMALDGVRGSVNYDSNDRYCLDGQRLILVSGTEGTSGAEYRTERDSFSRITAHGSAGNGPAYFLVKAKAGLTVEYGNTEDSRIEAQGKTSARVWAQNKVSDVKGNILAFTYNEDSANGEFNPNGITYGDNSIQLVYETRPDAHTGYHLGSKASSSKRLKEIKTLVGAGVVQRFTISYSQSAFTQRSLLSAVQACDAQNICLPSVQMTYGTDSNAFASTSTAWVLPETSSGAYMSRSDAGQYQGLVDLNGDGLPDFYKSNTSQLWLNTGAGFAGTPVTWALPVTASGLYMNRSDEAGQYQGLVDLNGDGLLDFYKSIAGQVSLNTGTGFASTPVAWDLPETSSGAYMSRSDEAGQYQGLIDLNGDGLPDFYKSNTSQAWLNTGTGFASTPVTWALPVTASGLYMNRSDEAGQYQGMVDLNGDGLPDFYKSSAGQVWFNTGAGFAATSVAWALPETSSGAYMSRSDAGQYQALVDLNGDGLPDFYKSNTSQAWLNTGMGFASTPVSWAVPVTASGAYMNRSDEAGQYQGLVDLNGDGLPDFYKSSAGQVWVGKINLAQKLTQIASVSQTPISISYVHLAGNSTYTKDSDSVFPRVDLIVPMLIVSATETSNGVGGTNTVQYSYGGLKAEQGTGRGMLGFRWMKSKSVANNIESYTEFNQNYPFTGTVAKNETRLTGSGNAGLLKRTVNTFAQGPGSAGTSVFVYPSQSVEESWDLSGTPYPSTTTSYVYGQSPQYGDPTQISVSNSEGSSKSTTNEYWPANTGSGNWILGRLKKASVTSVKP
jgi:hypothetical protein